jgi:hypothetical protein
MSLGESPRDGYTYIDIDIDIDGSGAFPRQKANCASFAFFLSVVETIIGRLSKQFSVLAVYLSLTLTLSHFCFQQQL